MPYIINGTTDLDFTEASSDAKHAAHLGREFQFSDGLICVLGQAAGTLAAGDFVCWNDGGQLVQVTTAAVADAGAPGVAVMCGVVCAAAASGEYVWVSIVKNDDTNTDVGISTLASTVADLRLNTTTTAGALDDDNTVGSFIIEGLQLSTATGGAPAVNLTSRWHRPYISGTN